MPKTIDWNVVGQEYRAMRAADKSQTQSQVINVLAKKYRRSYTTIYTHLRKRPPLPLRRAASVRAVPRKRGNGNGKLGEVTRTGMFSDVVNILVQKREMIDKVIHELAGV